MAASLTCQTLFWKRFLERLNQLAKRIGAVADAVLQLRIELSESPIVADGNEHRVVAETPVTARRPHENAVDPAIEGLGLTIVGPGDRERAGEMAGRRGVRLGRLGL